MTRNAVWACLILGLMAGLLIPAVGTPGLDTRSLWGDEGWSIRFADPSSAQGVMHQVVEDRHPPFYFLMLHEWRRVAGDSVPTMRFLGVLASLLTAALLYQFGKAMYTPTAGLCAMLIFAISDKQAIFAQEVRHYSIFLMWVVAASLALVLWHQRPSRWRSVAVVLTLLGGLYTHVLMTVVILIHLIYNLLVLRPWHRWTPLITLYGFAFFGALPWFMVTIYQYQVNGGVTPSLPLTWESVERLAPEMLGNPLVLILGLLGLAAISPWVTVATGWQAKRPTWQAMSLPILGVTIPLMLVVLLTSDRITLLNDRNLALTLPFVAILIGVGITAFHGFGRVALIVFIILNGLLTADVEFTPPPWRNIGEYMGTHHQQADPIIFNVQGASPTLNYYLREETGRDTERVSMYDLLRDPNRELLTDLRFQYLDDETGFWVVYWGQSPELFATFDSWGFQQTFTKRFTHQASGIDLYRYDATVLLDEVVILYGEQVTLHQVQLPQPDESVVALWWSHAVLDMPLNGSVIFFDLAGNAITNVDQPLRHEQTTLYYADYNVPDDLPLGDYQVGVKIYNAIDGNILPTTSNQDYEIVGTISIGG